MVYRGTPSRGCQMCQTRRIKCDETKPICKQCLKGCRVCPGYKTDFDPIFRNETLVTETRVRRLARKTSENDRRNVDSSVLSGAGLSLTRSPQLPLEDHAACHFISNYVLVSRRQSLVGFMEFLIPLWKGDRTSPHFKYAFEACALASLNNGVGNRNHFEKQALAKYTKALSATFEALSDPRVAKDDATLAAVILFGLFETITAKAMGRLAWGSHLEGAIQLVKARGREQLLTKPGLQMFGAVRVQMIIQSLTTSKPPHMDTSWWIDDACDDKHVAQCEKLCMTIGELRSETNHRLASVGRSPSDMAAVLDLMRRSQAYDKKCIEWSEGLPDYFKFKTVAWKDNIRSENYSYAPIYPGKVDVYDDLWISGAWNLMRAARIVLHSMIVRCAAWIQAPMDYRTSAEYAKAEVITVGIIRDVIASVPYQLGFLFNGGDTAASPSTFACGKDDSLKGLCGYFMAWPLAFIYSLDYLTDSQRGWVRGRLQYIGSELGVRFSSLLTQLKLNIRVPSMLIYKDMFVSPRPHLSYDFERQLSAEVPRPIPSSAVSQPVGEAKMARRSGNVDGPTRIEKQRTERWLEHQQARTVPI